MTTPSLNLFMSPAWMKPQVVFEQGWETRIATRGVGISLGEKKRIAISRAAIRRTPVMLWDEATCALITHCPSLVAAADKVVFLERGRVRAEGVHSDLLGCSPDYRALFLGDTEVSATADAMEGEP